MRRGHAHPSTQLRVTGVLATRSSEPHFPFISPPVIRFRSCCMGLGWRHCCSLKMSKRVGTMRGGQIPLTVSQRAMVTAARVLPQPVLMKLATIMAARAAKKENNHA